MISPLRVRLTIGRKLIVILLANGKNKLKRGATYSKRIRFMPTYTFVSFHFEWFRTELRLKSSLVMTPICQLLFPFAALDIFMRSAEQFALKSLFIYHSEPLLPL